MRKFRVSGLARNLHAVYNFSFIIMANEEEELQASTNRRGRLRFGEGLIYEIKETEELP